MNYNEQTTKTERIYEGKIISVRVDTVELPNMKYTKREIVEHKPVVCIVPFIDKDNIVFIKHYRKAIDKIIYEVPAGFIESNETPLDAANRELLEETGFSSKQTDFIYDFFSSPGYSTEKIYLFFAKIDKNPQSINIDSEIIETEVISINKAIEMIKRGEICDAKTIIAIYEINNYFEKSDINASI